MDEIGAVYIKVQNHLNWTPSLHIRKNFSFTLPQPPCPCRHTVFAKNRSHQKRRMCASGEPPPPSPKNVYNGQTHFPSHCRLILWTDSNTYHALSDNSIFFLFFVNR